MIFKDLLKFTTAWIIGIVLLFFVFLFHSNYDYTIKKPREGTIVAMSSIESGGKYSVPKPTLGIKLNDGTFYDSEVSLANYSQWHIGDKIIIHLPDRYFKTIIWKEIIDLFTLLILVSGIVGEFMFTVLIISMWFEYYKEHKDE